MTKTEFEKFLYMFKPKANFIKVQNGHAYYDIKEESKFHFRIPVTDMGDAPFFKEMDAQFLRRWIVESQTN